MKKRILVTTIKPLHFIALISLAFTATAYADLPRAGFNYGRASAAYIEQSTSNIRDNIYFGGSFGSSEAEDYCSITSGCEDKDSSWKGFVGYNINEIFAAEAAYTSIGDLHKEGTSSDISALSLSGVATLRVNDQFSAFGKIGFSRWKSENTEGNKSGSGLNYGVGAKVNLNESMKVRVEWERLPSVSTSNSEESDIDMLSVGIEMATF
jgi:OOP family OmpA-OmpF porin